MHASSLSHIHRYGFRHTTDGSAFNYVGSYVAFQRSVKVPWMQCGSHQCKPYYLFDSGSVHDVPAAFLIRVSKKQGAMLFPDLVCRSMSILRVTLLNVVLHYIKKSC